MLTSWGGLALLNPSFVAFLWRFASIFTIILGGLLLQERLGMKELPAAGVIVFGSLLSAVGQWNLVAVGMGLTIVACVLAGVQNVLAKIVVGDVHPSVLCVYRLGLGAVWVALWAFGTRRADFDVAPSHWWATLVGAFLGPWLSWLLVYEAYRRWALWRATLISMLQPLFVIPIAYVAFGDLPSAKESVGGALIMVGAAWFVRGHLETKKLARSDGRA
jgi:drug/metabolite transporter (DMT)-like permease